MFTGIITAAQSIFVLEEENEILSMTIGLPAGWNLEVGESITIDGVCSTVVSFSDDAFVVEYMPETLRITSMGEKKKGDLLNLERSITMNDRLSGHVVSGHVDSIGKLVDIVDEGDAHVVTIEFPPEFAKYLIHKGSIAVNGMSLTVIDPTESTFSISLIPHTWKVTNLHTLKIGDTVNLEFDQFAKYFERFRQYG